MHPARHSVRNIKVIWNEWVGKGGQEWAGHDMFSHSHYNLHPSLCQWKMTPTNFGTQNGSVHLISSSEQWHVWIFPVRLPVRISEMQCIEFHDGVSRHVIRNICVIRQSRDNGIEFFGDGAIFFSINKKYVLITVHDNLIEMHLRITSQGLNRGLDLIIHSRRVSTEYVNIFLHQSGITLLILIQNIKADHNWKDESHIIRGFGVNRTITQSNDFVSFAWGGSSLHTNGSRLNCSVKLTDIKVQHGVSQLQNL